MNDLWIIEVFYNKIGSLQDPDSPVHKNVSYHTITVPVIATDKDLAESKLRAWFDLEKPEQKIITLLSHKTIA